MKGSTNANGTTVEYFQMTAVTGLTTIFNEYCWADDRIVHIDVDVINSSGSEIAGGTQLTNIPDAYCPIAIYGIYPLFEVQILNGVQVYGGIGWSNRKGIFLDSPLPDGARFRLSYTYPRGGGSKLIRRLLSIFRRERR